MPEPVTLDEIEARWAAATPGPWSVVSRADGTHAVVADDATSELGECLPVAHCPDFGASLDDSDAIAHAPTDVAALVAELRAAREVVEAASPLTATPYEQIADETLDHDSRFRERLLALAAALDRYRA